MEASIDNGELNLDLNKDENMSKCFIQNATIYAVTDLNWMKH